MKLYVLNKVGSGKVFLRTVAPTRKSLAQQLGGTTFIANGVGYSVTEVIAEKGADNTSLGMLVGGVIGALVGGGGVAAGGLIGAMLGKEQDKKEEIAVAEFNGSFV